MVAAPASSPPSAVPADPPAVPPSALAGRGPLVRFTVDDVQAMLRAGLLPEDASTELLDGCIVRTDKSAHGGDPRMHSPGHRYSVTQLGELSSKINSPDRHVQTQLPIVCGSSQMPEPDFAVVRGTNAEYMDRLPTAADALCVVEVADSSLERDRDEKLPAYARAGVPQYVILNLRNRTAEVHEQPDRSTGQYFINTVVATDSLVGLLIGAEDRLDVVLGMLLVRVS